MSHDKIPRCVHSKGTGVQSGPTESDVGIAYPSLASLLSYSCLTLEYGEGMF